MLFYNQVGFNDDWVRLSIAYDLVVSVPFTLGLASFPLNNTYSLDFPSTLGGSGTTDDPYTSTSEFGDHVAFAFDCDQALDDNAGSNSGSDTGDDDPGTGDNPDQPEFPIYGPLINSFESVCDIKVEVGDLLTGAQERFKITSNQLLSVQGFLGQTPVDRRTVFNESPEASQSYNRVFVNSDAPVGEAPWAFLLSEEPNGSLEVNVLLPKGRSNLSAERDIHLSGSILSGSGSVCSPYRGYMTESDTGAPYSIQVSSDCIGNSAPCIGPIYVSPEPLLTTKVLGEGYSHRAVLLAGRRQHRP